MSAPPSSSSSSAGASDNSNSAPEPHLHPARRRLVKAASLGVKRDREGAPQLPAAAPKAAPGRINKGPGDEHNAPTPPKHGRPPLNPPPQDARPLGRQGTRPAATPVSKQHGEEQRIQQAKRAANLRAQTVGATGSFKSFDSPFGNYLVPVIPVHLASKLTSQPSK